MSQNLIKCMCMLYRERREADTVFFDKVSIKTKEKILYCGQGQLTGVKQKIKDLNVSKQQFKTGTQAQWQA